MRLTIDEYSKHFKMSKEMINSKLKARQLNYIIENGETYIIVTKRSIDSDKSNQIENDKEEKKEPVQDTKNAPVQDTKNEQITQPSKSLAKPKTTVATVIALYQRENHQLKEKILQLEKKIDKLIDDKEQMLRDEMQKIEQVYSAKDEQLKNILELMNKKLMFDYKSSQTIHDVETLQPKKKIEKAEKPKLVELRSYLRTLDLKSYQRKIIKKRFLAVHDSDVRIIQQNGKLYLDFAKYDYSDLLEY